MADFQPDYRHILQAAQNIQPERMPLYEHIICEEIMEQVLDRDFAGLYEGDRADKQEYFRNYCKFFREMGYDTVSFERCIGTIMPGSGALESNENGIIQDRSDFVNYPWEELSRLYFDNYYEDYQILSEQMPAGMKAIGGPGNGVFECVQDLVGFTRLCYIAADAPDLYGDLFARVGEVMLEIWSEFLREFADTYVVCRFGDDLGYKTATLLSPEDIKKHIIPQYKRIIDLVHSYNKPFLLHSCGNIFAVMDDLIETAGIDAKHSNEDQIATFEVWIEKYGEKIG
ncbi:MAG: uroporphyrinogen decarboxylase family protein, partial [Bacillota bacterium]